MHIKPNLFAHKAPLPQLPTRVSGTEEEEKIQAIVSYTTTLELLSKTVNPNSYLLDIGTGSGYYTACLAHLVGSSGHVVSIDKRKDNLVEAKENIKASYPELLERISFIEADALKFNYEKQFDAIHSGVAVPFVPPNWLSLLTIGGGMTLPLIIHKKGIQESKLQQTPQQTLYYITKNPDGKCKLIQLYDVDYVVIEQDNKI
uniref:protein-L-isoaspartate(D-aspartate) O-methyltransferase n=1 Tax=Arcella intermedia TaxID=1963864 RepID=A0A6B2LI05_9EUKA